ncbi:uncharacterized protein CCOS01_05854 [Colletotrichum costaricense]|uniref:Uncharacterized protein n=1 Tax=Colletotrichum costaricense TaxID=1209916 RepID=A0AAI9Z2G5_9PEZI|nr:uncharacterized protein CCOS01_05854 [Colletotrichum costaricense]KAK1530751.1 hypothetical protein CCOS01_05854 [Colletotrichum costaricense]
MSRGLNAFTWPKGLEEIKHYRDPELERAQKTGQRTLKCVLPSALSAVTQTGSVGIALRGLALSVDMADRGAARQSPLNGTASPLVVFPSSDLGSGIWAVEMPAVVLERNYAKATASVKRSDLRMVRSMSADKLGAQECYVCCSITTDLVFGRCFSGAWPLPKICKGVLKSRVCRLPVVFVGSGKTWRETAGLPVRGTSHVETGSGGIHLQLTFIT